MLFKYIVVLMIYVVVAATLLPVS
jgi:hypothetical protein